ncbi:uncharacterized protein N7483_002372 [Penicillium malachiteum]|uniref:uncharacterized protein n=1 Tax=Penicillium malachiteum TaxID=1324776 RepID=UPI00254747A4|nr:uncharacterized protein N7483_002372 [Penicillium malachiteum]KAJ5737247.1 hypothetical protein N7483_002372 [Penicillium malachiteum]
MSAANKLNEEIPGTPSLPQDCLDSPWKQQVLFLEGLIEFLGSLMGLLGSLMGLLGSPMDLSPSAFGDIGCLGIEKTLACRRKLLIRRNILSWDRRNRGLSQETACPTKQIILG